jgi:uncharacterized protein YgbK (DUF1537 family)
MAPRLGCIADDFTGATDVASMFQQAGLRVVQFIGAPDAASPELDTADVVVIALKTRTAPVAVAVAASLEALASLRAAGCQQIYFKYCSTFDSTPAGNIGPVMDALMREMDAAFTVACPAFPENGRTIYQGHLFVGDQLLSESGMRQHPLTPMTDPNLVRVLSAQWSRKVGLAPLAVVREGPVALKKRFDDLQASGVACAIVDAVDDEDLRILGEACADMPFVTAGSGLAIGLGDKLASGKPGPAGAANLPQGGFSAVISGSCSSATQRQVAALRVERPAYLIDPLELARERPVVEEALAWAADHLADGPVMIYATADTKAVQAVQAALGADVAGDMVEAALARIAVGLTDLGVNRFVVAGGETSGAVVSALGVDNLTIGPAIDPGVPWTAARLNHGAGGPVALALKSGNFGADDFFLKAWATLAAWEDAQ